MLSQRLADSEEDLSIATARLNTRSRIGNFQSILMYMSVFPRLPLHPIQVIKSPHVQFLLAYYDPTTLIDAIWFLL